MQTARRCLFLSALTLITAGLAVGCTADAAAWNFKRAVSTPGYADTTEMPDEEWITDAANTGREGRFVEKSNDPLNLRELFMSEKARSIERNVGIE